MKGVEILTLKEVIKERGISQRQLSIRAGISNQDVNQAINGKRPFFPAWRKRISEVLGMPESELFPEYQKRR